MTPKFHATVEARLQQNNLVLYPTYLTFFGNTYIPETLTTFFKVFIIPSNESSPIGVGPSVKSRNVGLIQIDALTKIGIGAGAAQDMVWTSAKSIYRSQLEVPGEGWITFRDPSGPIDMGTDTMHREIIRIPYQYDFVLP